MNILFIGDVVGNPGRKILKELLPQIKKELNIDFVIANGENAAGGSGINHVLAQELYSSGVDGITMGNHTWSKKEVFNFIDSDKKIVRPANYPPDVPGRGSMLLNNNGKSIGVINLVGRVYMDPADCPFRTADTEVERLKLHTKVVLVDMHAEATSEKGALAWHLDGRVTAVIGTHTHVQTADEKILPRGTAFITDVGMTGPYESVLGVDTEIIVKRFITQLPERFEVAKGPAQLCAVLLEVDEKTGRTLQITRVVKWLN